MMSLGSFQSARDVTSAALRNGLNRVRDHRAWSLLALGMALLLLAYGLPMAGQMVHIDVASNEIEPAVGRSFVLQLKQRTGWPWFIPGDQTGRLARSDLRLFEDGLPLGPANTQHEDIRRDGGGGFSHWQRYLLLSTRDQSDPRTNGRTYSITATARIVPKIINQTMVAGGACVLIALSVLGWQRRSVLLGVYRSATSHLWRRRWDYVAAGAFPGAVSAYAWLALPPIWNGSDSVIWLLFPLNLFPHHPIMYPSLMAAATSWFADSSTLLSCVTAAQHLTTVGALVYLASAFRVRWQIVMVSVLACLGVALNLYAQGLMTEALDLPLLCIVLGAVLRLQRDGVHPAVGAALFVGLLGSILTRHASVVFASIPLAYILSVALWSGRRWSRAVWVPVGGVVLALLAAGITAKWLTGSACHLLENGCISTVGRPGVYRIVETYQSVPDSRRGAWLVRLSSAAPNQETALALRLMAQTSGPWLGTRMAIAAEPRLWLFDPDALMNTGFWVFVRSLDVDALRQWARELTKAVFGPATGPDAGPGQLGSLLRGSAESIAVVFPPEREYLRVLRGTGAERPESAAQYLGLADLPATRLIDRLLPLGQGARVPLLLATWLLALAAVTVRRRPDFIALLLSIWLGFAVYALALTFVTVVLPRYLAPLDLLLWLSNAIALVALIEWALRRRPLVALVPGPREAPSRG